MVKEVYIKEWFYGKQNEKDSNDRTFRGTGLCCHHVHPHSHTGTSGYIHPGDAIVILAGIILGPAYGFLAAGIGSCLADLLGGYFVYVPITFAIKGLVALFAALAYKKIAKDSKTAWAGVFAGGIIDMVLVAGGYCLCEFFLYGTAAFLSVPSNLIQGASGLIISLILYPLLTAVPDIKRMIASA